MRTVASLVVLGSLLVACGSGGFSPPGDDAGTSNPGVGGGGGGDAGDAGDAGTQPDAAGFIDAALPPSCDGSKLPTDDACVVSEAAGVFVSSSLGSGGGNGSRQKPLASLDTAIKLAKAQHKRVYACAETYPEAIALQDGVSVFGYFDCNNAWTVGASRAKVKSPTSPAATASGIATTTRVEAVEIVAPDFTTGSQTSIGLMATGSPALRIVHGLVHAGTGGKGADGADGIQLTDSGSAKDGLPGWDYEACMGSPAFVQNCEADHSARGGGTDKCVGESGHDGGNGGSGGSGGEFFASSQWQVVSAATNGGAAVATAATAQGGVVMGSLPDPGSVGTGGANGGSGAGIGQITAAGYTPSDGGVATAGQPGQGGGGGAGKGMTDLLNGTPLNPAYAALTYYNQYKAVAEVWGTSGGGGGAGGCPGLPGKEGKGGGASIAVLATASPMTLEDVKVESSIGGDAGKAGVPSLPTAGGVGGSSTSQSGNKGGNGGNAGVSGNGGGGPSLGIVYHGGTVQLLASTVTQGAGGAGVAQRNVNGYVIPASPAGKSVDVYSF